jgi:hypothetical protein
MRTGSHFPLWVGRGRLRAPQQAAGFDTRQLYVHGQSAEWVDRAPAATRPAGDVSYAEAKASRTSLRHCSPAALASSDAGVLPSRTTTRSRGGQMTIDCPS